ncbi:MAG: TIGR00730 family Rossman fold protein [Marinilabiliaceae bacterium]
MRKACVFCASSGLVPRNYIDEARQLGERLAAEGWGLVYGGGSTGLMGAVADGALSVGGSVTGVIPRFMVEVEWQHKGVADMRLTDTMSERKRIMVDISDAIIVLPGSTGTLDELFEVVADKKLGLHNKPIALLNSNGFYDNTLAQLQLMVDQNFMTQRHLDVLSPATSIDGVLSVISRPPSDSLNLADAQVR